MEDTKTVADLIEINLTISALLRETNCQTLSEMAQELKANRRHIAERDAELKRQDASYRDLFKRATDLGNTCQNYADQIAERDAKLEAIKAVVRHWIDSKDRNLDNGGGMLEILAILYPPPAPTGTKRKD